MGRGELSLSGAVAPAQQQVEWALLHLGTMKGASIEGIIQLQPLIPTRGFLP